MRRLETGPDRAATRETPIKKSPSFRQWTKRFKERQNVFEQQENDVAFTFLVPSMINLMSDLHIGHPSVDYKRIENEVNAISSTPNSFVIFAGDLINNMNWNPGQMEEMEQTPEQVGYLRSILKHLAGAGKLLHHIQGDHDGWLKRSGMDIQKELPDMGVSVSNGPTFFHMKVGKNKYELAGAHQLPGNSIYNNTHPQMRAARFGSMHGADVIFSGHNHKKGMAKSYTHELGQPKEVTYIALGPYKSTDSWLSKKGFPGQKALEMFGASVYLNHRVREIETDMNIVRANKRMR